MTRTNNRQTIDDVLFNIEYMLIGNDRTLREAETLAAPLIWWLKTDRAPLDAERWLKASTKRQQRKVADLLALGGSYDEAIGRVRSYIIPD